MRLSVRRGDSGFSREAFGAKVFVDGQLAPWCHTADEELGTAICYAVDGDGRMMLNPSRDGAVEVELRGVIRIELPAATC